MTTTAQRPVREVHEEGFTSYDGAFRNVIGPVPVLAHVVDVDAHEGPVYAPDQDALYFTSLPDVSGSHIKRLDLDGTRFPLERERLSVVAATTVRPNGMTATTDGDLVVCEQGDRSAPARISRVQPLTGATTTVVDSWHGLPLNSPNDVVVRGDGTVWFTDPSYGFLQGFRPQPEVGDFVYRYDPGTGSLDVVADSFVKPNGLAFSPDGSVLYVTDSGANQEPGSFHVGLPHHVLSFDVTAGRLTGQRLFAVTTPGIPDGVKVDEAGRVYVSSPAGVLVHSPEGRLLGRINCAGAVNFAFGGPDRNVLYITTDTAVWAAVLDTKGT